MVFELLFPAMVWYSALRPPTGGAGPDRPYFETDFLCDLGLALAAGELKRYFLDPGRFRCEQLPDGRFTIVGKQRGEK